MSSRLWSKAVVQYVRVCSNTRLFTIHLYGFFSSLPLQLCQILFSADLKKFADKKQEKLKEPKEEPVEKEVKLVQRSRKRTKKVEDSLEVDDGLAAVKVEVVETVEVETSIVKRGRVRRK